MTPFWTVAQTHPSREGLAEANLQQAGFETYLPRTKVRDHQRNLRVVPLFPSYVFVRVIETWSPIASIIGVARILRNGEYPARLHDQVLAELKAREDRQGLIQLPTLRIGQRVRIVRGTFAGHIAVYEGMSGRDRERVLLEFLGRKVRAITRAGDAVALHLA